jgi:hypothetical protein
VLGLDDDVGTATWPDVLNRLDQALEAAKHYHDEAKGAKGVVRNLVRKMGHSAAVVEKVIEFIPDEKGLSLLKGSLALLFSVRPQICYLSGNAS